MFVWLFQVFVLNVTTAIRLFILLIFNCYLTSQVIKNNFSFTKKIDRRWSKHLSNRSMN